jgi:hypothetical protein
MGISGLRCWVRRNGWDIFFLGENWVFEFSVLMGDLFAGSLKLKKKLKEKRHTDVHWKKV